jgi:hypothetical protein
MHIPQISAEGKRVLQIIKERGVCNGRQLVAETELSGDQLVAAVKDLVNSELVSASGSTHNKKDIEHAYFNIRPSNASLAEFVLRNP